MPPTLFEEEQEERPRRVHLRIQRRSGRRAVTTIEGLDGRVVDLNRLVKALRKQLSCCGAVLQSEEEEEGRVIQLQGDQRQQVKDFLIAHGIVLPSAINAPGL